MRKNSKKIDKKHTENEIEEIWGDDKFDPNGSYVGTGTIDEIPVQDADDL